MSYFLLLLIYFSSAFSTFPEYPAETANPDVYFPFFSEILLQTAILGFLFSKSFLFLNNSVFKVS